MACRQYDSLEPISVEMFQGNRGSEFTTQVLQTLHLEPANLQGVGGATQQQLGGGACFLALRHQKLEGLKSPAHFYTPPPPNS